MHFDVFNGDADGIIALLQLRLAEPKKSTLITGVKRDIALLQRVPIADASSVTVLDVSMEKNLAALELLLANNIPVFYVDHHRTGIMPQSQQLTALIDLSADTCTSLIINNYLQGQFAAWAVAAAFGDNMLKAAEALAQSLALSELEQQQLQALGMYINYNGYGRSVDELHIAPKILFSRLLQYPDPFQFIATDDFFTQLEQGYQQDMLAAESAKLIHKSDILKVVCFEDEPWAHRISGVYGNSLANQTPDLAHAILTPCANDHYTVSLRAPVNNKQGAGELCAQFASGGGRAAAAGINQLPKEMLGKFIDLVSKYYQR